MKDWSASAHVIVEIPPGQKYCVARQALWQLAKDDASPHQPTHTYYFQHPKKIQVAGFVFYDKAPSHTDNGDCTANGGRGLHKNGAPSMVHGLWNSTPSRKSLTRSACPDAPCSYYSHVVRKNDGLVEVRRMLTKAEAEAIVAYLREHDLAPVLGTVFHDEESGPRFKCACVSVPAAQRARARRLLRLLLD